MKAFESGIFSVKMVHNSRQSNGWTLTFKSTPHYQPLVDGLTCALSATWG